MTYRDSFIAVDWGTTNRRISLIEGSRAVRTVRDNRGVTAVRDFAAEAADIRAGFGDLPLLLAGMVGSNLGWREAAYVATPAGMADLAGRLLRIDPRTAIVPGVCAADPPDVMRGEEVQLLGAVAAGMAPGDALIVQPGTHCKWARMAAGRIAGFTTAMTGELFALLRGHGLLATQLTATVTAGQAFREGIREGRKRDLAASLFGIRAAKLLDRRDDADAASFASGLLIGADVAARLAAAPDGPGTVYILADETLGALYAAAIEAHGCEARIIDSHAAFIAGIIAIGQLS